MIRFLGQSTNVAYVQREFPVMGFIDEILVIGIIVRPLLEYDGSTLNIP